MINIHDDHELLHYIMTSEHDEMEDLFKTARAVCEEYYSTDVYFRGLIEFSNYCKNNCLYCGIRADNPKITRYRLTEEQILHSCRIGNSLGFRTFVLQSGEDPYFTDKRIIKLIENIKKEFPDHAITLSLGEKNKESYRAYFKAGANRYLLRHETANEEHYRLLHPQNMMLKERKQCLYDLKDIGYQVGAGFMVGTPFQSPKHLLEDLHFLRELEPHMVGIGPFIPQTDTPFGTYPSGTLEMTLKMVALTRLILPKALLPATTALGTISSSGREKGLMAGANVVMPNLSPREVRKLYALYDDKICTGDEAAACRACMENRIRDFGFTPNMARGDFKGFYTNPENRLAHCP